LELDNCRLLRENERLTKLLEEAGISSLASALLEPAESRRYRKRAKQAHENRVNPSFDSSESAAFASSPQTEFLLAVVTTVLCSQLMHQVPRRPAPAATAAMMTCSSSLQALATRIIRRLRMGAARPCGPSSEGRGKLPESTRGREKPSTMTLTSNAWERSSPTSTAGELPARMGAGASYTPISQLPYYAQSTLAIQNAG
jgi:hypothetical protein